MDWTLRIVCVLLAPFAAVALLFLSWEASGVDWKNWDGQRFSQIERPRTPVDADRWWCEQVEAPASGELAHHLADLRETERYRGCLTGS